MFSSQDARMVSSSHFRGKNVWNWSDKLLEASILSSGHEHCVLPPHWAIRTRWENGCEGASQAPTAAQIYGISIPVSTFHLTLRGLSSHHCPTHALLPTKSIRFSNSPFQSSTPWLFPLTVSWRLLFLVPPTRLTAAHLSRSRPRPSLSFTKATICIVDNEFILTGGRGWGGGMTHLVMVQFLGSQRTQPIGPWWNSQGNLTWQSVVCLSCCYFC